MRPLLWLGEQRIRLIAKRRMWRMFRHGQLPPEVWLLLKAPAKRRTP